MSVSLERSQLRSRHRGRSRGFVAEERESGRSLGLHQLEARHTSRRRSVRRLDRSTGEPTFGRESDDCDLAHGDGVSGRLIQIREVRRPELSAHAG